MIYRYYSLQEVFMTERILDSKQDILKRLNRIEGQVKGIHKMIDEDKNCGDILTQISAVRAAINKVGSIILEKHSLKCLENLVSSEDKEKALSELTRTMQTFMK